MDGIKFKELWLSSNHNSGVNFDQTDIELSNLSLATKEFLTVGFAREAAPCIDFGSNNNPSRLITNYNYWSLV